MNTSLPVEIFERKSNLERFALSFSYAPTYFKKFDNPLDEIKSITAFGITNMVMYLNLDKPFNPILGETY